MLDEVVVEIPSVVFVDDPVLGGLSTRTRYVPDVAMLEAGIVAVNCWLLTKLGVKMVPLNSTVELLRKSFPLMVNVKSPPPALALLGEIDAIDGGCEQAQDTPIASVIASAHTTDSLAAIAMRRWQAGSGKPGNGRRRVIQQRSI